MGLTGTPVPLPLGEVSAKQTERASPLPGSCHACGVTERASPLPESLFRVMRQKLLRALLLRVVDELAGRAFLHHDAAVHE